MKLKQLFAAAALCVSMIGYCADAPKYIFYFIGDGMGLGPVMATEAYIRLAHNDEHPLIMTQFPVATWAQTWSASSPVTDSAAAGTALSTGYKTKNGMLGMTPDSVSVTSIARILKDDGYGVGIISSSAIDDATPGAFYAHVPYRSMYYEVGKDAAASGYDFFGGSGLRGNVDKKGNATDLYDLLAKNNYKIYRGAEGAKNLSTTTDKKVILLNPENYGNVNQMGYVVDNRGGDGIGLTLPMTTEVCINHLVKNSPDKFFMMCEGSLIDHALHSNDGSAAIKEVIDLNQCIEQAYQFYLSHPDETLIVVTADHDTGGMSTGCKSTGYNAFFNNVDCQKITRDRMSEYFKVLLASRQVFTWEDMQEYLKENFDFWGTVKVTEAQEQELKDVFNSTFVQRTAQDEKGLYNDSNAFAAAVMRVYANSTGFGFTTPNHTGNPVPVFAIGVGSERFTHRYNNSDIPKTILSILGK
jgi:alkaline phosphatase